MPPDQAQAAAVAQFGSPQAVADAFTGELATAYARRTIALFVLTGPLVGIWWLLLLHARPVAHRTDRLARGDPRPPADRRRDRHRRRHPRHHRTSDALAPGGNTGAGPDRHDPSSPGLCIAGDLTMIGLFLASEIPLRPLAIVAIAASIIRIACGITVIRRAGRMRAPFHVEVRMHSEQGDS